jgi:AraC-like DNA-binding protein
MDRHDVTSEVTAEHVANIHQEDLKIQHKYECRGFTYWFDNKKKTAFCLIEAPNKEAIVQMHNEAHGSVPNHIIEVDEHLVDAFLGRVTDPESENTEHLKIISESGTRFLMVIETSNHLNRIEANQFSIFTQKFHNSVIKTFRRFNGRIIKQDNNSYLLSFRSVTDAVLCALKIRSNFKYITPKFDLPNRRLNIGICAGDPVTERKYIFEEAIVTATRICENLKDTIGITSEIKILYEKENRNSFINKEDIRTLRPAEEGFLNKLIDYVEEVWNDAELSVDNFSRTLGYSRSQIYRKLIAITGKSPNEFIRDYRLNRALTLLYNHRDNIQEVAYKTGFNSPTYFTKCFHDKFGILPSKYIQQHGT